MPSRHNQRRRRLFHVASHLQPWGASADSEQGNTRIPENPIPFAGLEEAASQHLAGLGVFDGSAPDEIRAQYLKRMEQLGLPIPENGPLRTASYHTAEAAQREPILDWAAVEAQLSMEAFLRDGVQVLRSVWLPSALVKLRQSCENVQVQNDAWLEHDWHEPEQWARLGWHPPTCAPLTENEKVEARGGCQLLTGTLRRITDSVRDNNPQLSEQGVYFGSGALRDERTVRWPVGMGVCPEHIPILYDDFLMDCITHPQMIRIHQILLGSEEIRFDHNTLLSRRSFVGQHWHSHNYVEDNAGRTTHLGGAKLRLCRSLIYPDGFADTNDGGLKVVPGAHLYRSRDLADSTEPYQYRCLPGAADDTDFEQTWLKDKRHPLTGEKLAIQRLALPPGSMVVVLHHSPHAVEPRPEGTGTRHCTLFSYRAPDPTGSLPVTTNADLQPWELERDACLGKIEGVPPGLPNLFSLY